MPLYSCDLCNYSTKYKSDYTKHANTNKHRLKLISYNTYSYSNGVMNTNEHKVNTNEHKVNTNEHKVIENSEKSEKHTINVNHFTCEYCAKMFNTKASMRRHIKRYCKENPDFIDTIIDAKDSKIDSL